MRGDSYLPVLFMKEIIRKEYGYERKKWIKNGIAAAAIFMAMALAGCKIQIRDREAASQFSLKVHKIRPVRLKTQRKILLS